MRAVYYAVFHPYKLVKDTRTGGCSVGVHVKQGEGVSSRAHAKLLQWGNRQPAPHHLFASFPC